jgi:hypothetical protein
MDSSEKKKRKKKGGGAGTQQVQVAPEKTETWWELWEEFKDMSRNAYDVSVPASSRYVLALNDGKWECGTYISPLSLARTSKVRTRPPSAHPTLLDPPSLLPRRTKSCWPRSPSHPRPIQQAV